MVGVVPIYYIILYTKLFHMIKINAISILQLSKTY